MTTNEPRQASVETPISLRSKLESRTVQIGFIGLGYVGLPLGLLFARNGFPSFDLLQTLVAETV